MGACPDSVYDQLPQRVVFGVDAARTAIAPEIDRLGARRVLAIASTRDAERVAALLAPLDGRVAARSPRCASTSRCRRRRRPATPRRVAGADLLLAIGGGSTIGAAKAVAMTARLPIVAVPTTYAGSEITPIWGLTEEGRKNTGVDPVVLPRVVIYDPTLTATLPPDLAAASGFNALAHAVEAMWAPGRNPVSTAVAAEAVERLATGPAHAATRRSCCAGRGWARPRSRWPDRGCTTSSATCSAARSACRTPARTPSCCRTCWRSTRPARRTRSSRVARALGVDDAVAGLRALADAHGIPRGCGRWGCPKPPSRKPPRSRHPPCPPTTRCRSRTADAALVHGGLERLGRRPGTETRRPRTETRRHENGDSPPENGDSPS